MSIAIPAPTAISAALITALDSFFLIAFASNSVRQRISFFRMLSSFPEIRLREKQLPMHHLLTIDRLFTLS